jgi:hypothetical protein
VHLDVRLDRGGDVVVAGVPTAAARTTAPTDPTAPPDPREA